MPGRLGDIVELFQQVVIPLFRKHGMVCSQIGTTAIGDRCFGELVYVMRFASLSEMDEKWRTFLADSDWQSAISAKETGAPLYQSIRRRVIDSSEFDATLGPSAH
jgi:NIPSNAP